METQIHISDQFYPHTSADGQDYEVHDLTINQVLLADVSFNKDGISKLDIFSFKYGMIIFKPDDLVQMALRKYFVGFHDDENRGYDCRAFVCDVLNVEYHMISDMHNHIMFERTFDISRSQSQIIYHMKNGIFQHASVVLSEDLLLSVWGAGGHLTVTDVERTQRAFPGTEMFLVKKR